MVRGHAWVERPQLLVECGGSPLQRSRSHTRWLGTQWCRQSSHCSAASRPCPNGRRASHVSLTSSTSFCMQSNCCLRRHPRIVHTCWALKAVGSGPAYLFDSTLTEGHGTAYQLRQGFCTAPDASYLACRSSSKTGPWGLLKLLWSSMLR